MSKQFSTQNFQSEVIEASNAKPVLVDFFASWCGPCRMQGPIIDEVATAMDDTASVGKLDTEASQEIAMQYGVMSIPTLIIFRNGQPAQVLVGLQSKEALVSLLQNHM